ncbi:MAG: hypothetical protein ACI9SE_001045 [Neolewinella sp.]|jgi:hypothetical protein
MFVRCLDKKQHLRALAVTLNPAVFGSRLSASCCEHVHEHEHEHEHVRWPNAVTKSKNGRWVP